MPETAGETGTADFLQGGGDMGARMRALDWSRTPIGPVERWPQSLRTSVSICLASQFPLAVLWGPELVLLYNDGYRQLLGGKHPQALGRPVLEVWSEITSIVGPVLHGVLQDGTSTWVADQLLPTERNGFLEEAYFTYSYSPIRGERGGIGGIFAVVSETTDRVLGERRLRILRELAALASQARTVEEACRAAVRALEPSDVPFALVYLLEGGGESARLVASSGLEPGSRPSPEAVDLLARDIGWPLGKVARSGRMEVVDDVVERFGALPGTWPHPPRTALVLPIARPGEAHPYGLLVAGTSPACVLGEGYRSFFELAAEHVATAIANARASEAEHRRAEALAELDRAKTAFFSNVSHELRTPLTLLLLPIESALAKPDKALQSDDLELTHRNALRLLKLVNTLLDFSRIEAGRAEARYEPTDLAALTADLASAFRSAVDKAGLGFVVDTPPLPEPIHVDREMWEKIVLNLLSNALKFTFEGEIRVSLRMEGEQAVLAVQDTGTGIAAEELPRIFERFHRIRGARSRAHEGTGIGLALVQELVHLHGGTIRAESTPGAGTTFTVTIPRGSAHLPEENIGAARQLDSTALGGAPFVAEALRWVTSRPGQSEAPRSNEEPAARILVVDDNADMRTYLERLLAPCWTVTAVADGRTALSIAQKSPPDLVLSDVMMPGHDGFELIRALRADERTRTVPVILLSARAGEEATVEGLEAGADDYLVKPFAARELLARIRTNIKLARLRREAEALSAELAQKRAELLRLSEDRLRLAVEATGLGIWELDPENGKLGWDERCRAMFGLPKDSETSLDDALAAIHPDDRDAVRDGIARALDPASSGEYEVEHRVGDGADGKERWLAARGHAVFAEGRPTRFLGTLLDVTERAELMARERRARAAAEDANRLKDEFLATVSHELRTPLTAILGWSAILQDGARNPSTLSRGLEVIVKNAKAQAQLIDDILDVSRIIAGKLRIEDTPADIPALVREAMEVVEPSANAKGISLRYEDGGERYRLLCDPDRLRQAIWNVLSNAVKFSQKGGSVRVTVGREGARIFVRVADKGEGITPEVLPHVFERFRQADGSTTRRHGGLGLGLALVKHLVELHGGEVVAESAGKGQGATFTIRLPVKALAVEARTGAEERTRAAVKRQLLGVRVLVVDDEEDAREMLTASLEGYGAVVQAAASTDEALRALAQFSPHVLVSDIGMPEEDGKVLLRRIRALPEPLSRLPAIAVTAFARAEDAVLAREAGFDEYLVKPVEPQVLARIVGESNGRALRESGPG
ncbi:GAF domain-containing hybrid sensor histidine kinase/response regulator [Polyangium aurulentum]|uniref:GAF domain-containing hybrid sensor histidine kinase/response regulator n=1 Tax=Polyangium aurulentum TaxID=2567896 RepID=UPI0010AE2653|nr:GAF domain-containing hybrid sensor histidine kinase/response regulator [Polyangium aurulentum]UQA57758.1 response regulator [Polyangium aurulentum]